MPELDAIGFRQVVAAGLVREVGGNTPFLLDGAARVWFVRRGSVEMFIVRTGPDASRGMRHHFLSAAQGDLLFGMDLEVSGQGLGLLAVGVVGTELVEIPLAALRALARDPAEAAALVARVDTWVAALSAGVSKHITPKPRADVLIEPGTTAVVPKGGKVRPRKGLVWVRQQTGRSLFIGMEETDAGDPPARVPVSQDTWLEVLTESEVEAVETVAAFADESIWPALESLYDLVLKCEAYNTTLAAVDEYNRLTKKAERDIRAQQESLRQLAAILGGSFRAAAAPGESDDPLFLACAAVGRAAGIDLQPPPKGRDEGQAPRLDPLLGIAKASGVRTRPVVLDGQWWRMDQGPLLAYVAEQKQPVALLPASATRYDLFDPRTATTIPVTAAVAATLAPGAVMFYAAFGERAVTGARLLAFGLRACGSDLWRIALMVVGGGLLGLAVPVATGLIFQTLVPQAERTQLTQVGLGLAVAAITAALLQITQGLALLRVESRLDAEVNAAVMDRVLKLPTAFFRQFSSGDLGTRVTALSNMRQMLSGAVVGTVFGALTALPSVGLLAYYDVRLALVAAGVLALTIAIIAGVGRRQLDRQFALHRLEGRLAGVVLEILTGISKLRVAGAEGHAFALWADAFGRQRRVAFQAREATNLLAAFQAALPILALALVFGTVAFFGGPTPISTGDFLAFNAAFTQVLLATLALGGALMSVLAAVPLYQRVRVILDAIPEVSGDKLLPGDLSGDIEMSHVSFRYDPSGPLVLKDVSFRAGPGEFIAFVGPSGSGKSTLLRLLLGFEHPERGTVEYDGQNLAALDVAAVRRQLGVVLQHSKIMPGDIYRNIVGTSLLTIDDAWEAARQVALDEDIKLMPMGMHTMISEGGSTFSGGQRQRLLIVRALAQGPRIVFFDEATSALDNRTQAVVSESLDRLQATRLVIAHRLSTVINADRIHVMVAGQIVQTGTYQQLIEQEGVFADLVRRQLV